MYTEFHLVLADRFVHAACCPTCGTQPEVPRVFAAVVLLCVGKTNVGLVPDCLTA